MAARRVVNVPLILFLFWAAIGFFAVGVVRTFG